MKATLMIKDLSASKALDSDAMVAVRGGYGDVSSINQGIVSPVTVGPTGVLNAGPATVTVNNNPTQTASSVQGDVNGFGFGFPFFGVAL